MRGYILKTGARVAPFDDLVGDVLVVNRRLEDYQREALRSVCTEVEVIDSLEQARGEEFLLVEDHLFLTPQFLRRALTAARSPSAPAGSLRFALGASAFLKEKAPLGGHLLTDGSSDAAYAPLPLILWRGAKSPSADDVASLPLTKVFIKERKFAPGVKQQDDDVALEYSLTSEGVQSVRHWAHILDINQAAVAAFWLDFSPRRVLWLIWKVISAFSFNKWKIGGNINVIGRGCEIHPTSWVAGSILGDNVHIGPHTAVFGSVLGDGAKVAAGCELTYSVLGPRAVANFHTRLAFSVCYPQSTVSYPAAQMCLLGHRAMHMGGCYPIDMKLSQGQLLDVKVKHQGEIVNSGKKFLGACLGHRSIVGTGLWLNSGLEVPNDYVVVRDRDDLVIRIPEGYAGQTLSLQAGRLKPYQR
jgi:hypothetical protein